MNWKNKITLLLFLLIGGLVSAQRPGGGGMRPMMQQAPNWEEMAAELQLSEEQVGQLNDLDAQLRSDIQGIMQGSYDNPEDRKAAMKQRMDQHRQAVQEILNDEQEARLKEKRQEQREQQKENRQKRASMHEEMRAYHQENVLPVMQKQRAKLDERMSAEDKATVARLRSEMAQHREAMRQAKKEGKGKPEFRADKREQHQQWMAEIRTLTEKYQSDIDALLAELEPQRKQWKSETEAIARRYELEGKSGQGPGKGKMGHMIPDLDKKRFLLLDPAQSPDKAAAELEMDATETDVFPNPAVEMSTIQYKIKKAGPVRIELSDKTGRLVQVLLDEHREAGDYSLELDVSRFNDGVYYYTVIDQTGKKTKKLVVSK